MVDEGGKKKSKKGIVVFVILLFIGVGSIVLYLCLKEEKNEIGKQLETEFDPDICVYGEQNPLGEMVRVRTISEISEESIWREEAGYHAIVLWDLKGTMTISEDELLLIKKYAEEKGLDMFYLGSDKLSLFTKLKFTTDAEADEYSLEYIGSRWINTSEVQQNDYGNLYCEHGLLNEEDYISMEQKDICNRIINLMLEYAKELQDKKVESSGVGN